MKTKLKSYKFYSIYVYNEGKHEGVHKIDGPAFIRYRSREKKEIYIVYYFLYNKLFHPWWINEK